MDRHEVTEEPRANSHRALVRSLNFILISIEKIKFRFSLIFQQF